MAVILNKVGINLNRAEREKVEDNWRIIEKGLTDAEGAGKLAELAELAAADAKKAVANAQRQINELVVSGDSSPQAIQASVGADGTDYDGNLKARLDAEFNATAGQLAEKANEDEVRKKSVLIGQLDVNDEFKQILTGNRPVLQTIADKMISRRKTSFIKSKNIFNKFAVTNGYLGADGNVIADSSWRTSDFLQLSEGETLRSNGNILAYAFYTVGNVFISRTNGVSVKEVVGIAGGYYIRVQFGSAAVDTMVITKNETVPSLYIPFHEKIDTDLIGDLEKTAFKDFDVDFEELSFTDSVNKFDKTKVNNNQYMSYIDGIPLINASYGWLFMPVEGGASYIRNKPNQHFAWFDGNGNLLTNTNAPQTSAIITAPANASRIAFSALLSDLNTQMFVKGTTLPSQYAKHQKYIPKSMLDPSVGSEAPIVDPVDGLINLPSTIHSVVGMSNEILFDNIMSKANLKDVDVVATKGVHQEKKYTHTFTAAETMPITFTAFRDGKQIGTKTINVAVKAPTEVTANFKAVVIGDSNTNNGAYTQKLLDLFASDASSDIELVGTRGTAPNRHEGRSGWSAAVYTGLTSLSGVSNAFWNPSTSQFDFPYYVTQNGITGLTHVFINLGTNDIFNFSTDAAMISGTPTILADFDKMINSIKAQSASIKIGVMLTMPASLKQNDFGSAYGAGQNRWRYKRNYDYFLSEVIKKYDNRTAENIYLVASHLSVDPDTDFVGVVNTTPAVHPNETTGLPKIGEQVYKFLKVVG